MSELIDDSFVESALSEISDAKAPMESTSEADLQSNAKEADTPSEVMEAFLKLDRDGKEIGLDQAKAKAYAQKGFDYETKMHNLRVERQLFDKERDKNQESFKELKEINDYAKQNPEWERFLHEQWSAKQQEQAQQGNPAYQQQYSSPEAQQVAVLQNQLNDVLKRLDGQTEEMRDRKAAELDSRLQGEIDSYKEQYSDFDWATQDELGLSLEGKIQQHAIDKGIKGFTAAARDFLWDEHMKRAGMNSKEQVGKAVAKEKALGLGKVTKESQLQTKSAKGVRDKSYADLTAEAMAELGIS
jgi:hypothetical protein